MNIKKIYNYFFLFNLILCVIIDIRAWAIGKYGIFLFWNLSSKMPFLELTYNEFFESTYFFFLIGLFFFILILQLPIYLFSISYKKNQFGSVCCRWLILVLLFVLNDAFAASLSSSYFKQCNYKKITSDPYLCVRYCEKGNQTLRFLANGMECDYLRIISDQSLKSKQFTNGHWYLFKCNKKATMGELIGEASFYQKMFLENKIIKFSQMEKIDNLRVYSDPDFLQDLVKSNFDTIPPYKIRIISTVVSTVNNNICYFLPTVNQDEIWTCSNNSLRTGDSVLVAYLDRNHRAFDIYKTHPSKYEFDYCNDLSGIALSDSIFKVKKFFSVKRKGEVSISNYYPRSQSGIFYSASSKDEYFPYIQIEIGRDLNKIKSEMCVMDD